MPSSSYSWVKCLMFHVVWKWLKFPAEFFMPVHNLVFIKNSPSIMYSAENAEILLKDSGWCSRLHWFSFFFPPLFRLLLFPWGLHKISLLRYAHCSYLHFTICANHRKLPTLSLSVPVLQLRRMGRQRSTEEGRKGCKLLYGPCISEGIIRQFCAIRHPHELTAALQCPVCQAVRADGTKSGCFVLWTPPLCWAYIPQASRSINISHMQILC